MSTIHQCWCKKTFNHASSLSRHRKDCKRPIDDEPTSSSNGNGNGSLLCGICDNTFGSMTQLCTHLVDTHSMPAEIKNIEFSNEDEYVQWRKEIERSDCFEFIRQRERRRRKSFMVEYLQCHRSGRNPSVSVGVRAPKRLGSNKTGFTCSAFAVVRVDLTTGVVAVKYCRDHYGHDLQPARMRLSDEIREEIMEHILNDRSVEWILQKFRYDAADAGEGSLFEERRSITRHDIRNVEKSYAAPPGPRKRPWIDNVVGDGTVLMEDEGSSDEESVGESVETDTSSPSHDDNVGPSTHEHLLAESPGTIERPSTSGISTAPAATGIRVIGHHEAPPPQKVIRVVPSIATTSWMAEKTIATPNRLQIFVSKAPVAEKRTISTQTTIEEPDKLKPQSKSKFDLHELTDARFRAFIGISRPTFQLIFTRTAPLIRRTAYWTGPNRMAPGRSINQPIENGDVDSSSMWRTTDEELKVELFATLMNLRGNASFEILCCMFGWSHGKLSSVVRTWMNVLRGNGEVRRHYPELEMLPADGSST